MTSEENNEMEKENPNEIMEKERESKVVAELPQNTLNGANSATANGFRVKNVSEINDSIASNNGINDKATTNKRKFPAPSEQEENKENGGKENQNKNYKHHNDDDDDNESKKSKHDEGHTMACSSNNDINSVQQTTTGTLNINAVTAPNSLPDFNIEMENVENITDNTATTSNEHNNNNTETENNKDVKVKLEPASTDEIGSDTVNNPMVPKPLLEVKKFKTEVQDNAEEASCSHTSVVNEPLKVEKAAASSTTRESCRFGIRCYRRNIIHRQQEAHPGDVDYSRPTYPSPPAGTPPCPFGHLCYRRNPTHFQEYSHPPNSEYQVMPLADFKENYRNYRIQQSLQRMPNIFDDTDDDQDVFSDSGSEYLINDNELESSDSDEIGGDYDDCDRAEE